MAEDNIASSHEQLLMAIQNESRRFQEFYVWLEKTMPPLFFEEMKQENIMLIAHHLMGFQLQEYFTAINLKRSAIVMCLDSPDADLRILKDYAMYGIKNYQCYISLTPPPFRGLKANLRIAMIYFTEAIETVETPYPKESKEQLRAIIHEKIPEVTNEEFEKLFAGINVRFLRSMSMERLVTSLEMFWRAKTRDNCQYEVRYNQDWEEKGVPSMQIVLAWRNSPKHNFLFRLARTIHSHGLMMKRVNATYINPYSQQNVLIMSLGLHGSNGKAVWDVCEIPDFLRELATVKYFPTFDTIDQYLVSKGIISGNMGNLLRALSNMIHQALVHVDPNLYDIENIEDGLCRHPELTMQLCDAFKRKFDSDFLDYNLYQTIRAQFLSDVNKLDTGQESIDRRRKTVLRMAMSLIENTLKTNFYRLNYTAISFRLDPKFLNDIPFDRTKKFPILPYGIFFIQGMHFFGYHIRFKELSRGGLRTIFIEQSDQLLHERNSVFNECYNLALTQQMKNKDIPEGGSKGIIFLTPLDRLDREAQILLHELEDSMIPVETQDKIAKFRVEQKVEYLHQAQRSYIESLLSLINCEPDGTLRAKYIVDYWKQPEYLYLGPDENMHDEMIQWIADFSKKYNYKPGSAFITGKPRTGINHKSYGVTSLGMTVYMDALLRYIGVDPTKEVFTVKMSGGPDGDVAGNQIVNFAKYYPTTAKLIALTDVSGTIYDPDGLDLNLLVNLFNQGRAIRYYPPDKLHSGGFLVDKSVKRFTTPYNPQTLCWRKTGGKLQEEWLAGSDTNQLLRSNIHHTTADVFIPGGGRPRSLNESNFGEFIAHDGKPTAKIIIEGANLYVSPKACQLLEKVGTLIVKDSSANKTGVVCSSYEVLCGLTLDDERFLKHKTQLVNEILEKLKECTQNEAALLLHTHRETGSTLTEISDLISERINTYTYQLLDFLDKIPLSNDPNDPLLKTFLNYCLPTLRTEFQADLIKEIPEHHKKAIIACHVAAQLVYQKGLSWHPSIVDVLPVLIEEQE